MNIVSAVANLVKERDYYKEQYEDCRAIIKQLTEGPGEVEYIHPFDLMVLCNSLTLNSAIDIWKFEKEKDVTILRGKKYKQSANIPVKTKGII